MNNYCFYLIKNGKYTYAGISNDPVKRLRQHNSEIKGGAKYTTSKTNEWKHVCIIKGFQDKSQAMKFEWAVKHVEPKNAGGVLNRIIKIYTVLNKKFWTLNSPESSSIPLHIEWYMDIPLTNHLVPDYITQVKI